MTDDSELLRRYAAEGSEDAFRELVNRRIALVYGSALRQLGDPSRARDELGWEPKIGFEELVAMMVDADLELLAAQGSNAGDSFGPDTW